MIKERNMASNDTKEKKPGRLKIWWRETIGELKKVAWPTRRDAIRLTIMVLIVMAAMGTFLGILDWLFSRVIQAIIAA
jgi:preprotein translocase subunit SecE